VPTPTPTPAPTGALLFDVETGEATILPGDFTARKWLDTEAQTFTSLSGKPSVIDAQGNVTQISEHSGGQVEPDTDNHRVVIWDWEAGLLEVVDTDTLEVVSSGEFGAVPVGTRSWAVSPVAGKVAITDEPYQTVTVYNLDASIANQVFNAEPDEYVWGIDWSRDGEWLLVRARTEEDNIKERSLIFQPDGTLVMEYAAYANWAGARALRLYKRESGTRLVIDSMVDMAHQGQIPIPEGDLLCVSPDGRYAVTAVAASTAFNAPTEHRLVDLVTGDVVSSVVMNRFLVNCDWTPDGGKAILSSGGK
jgi:DNA-binding beta-propeller fold protein YncE